jgi:hypothetical protein
VPEFRPVLVNVLMLAPTVRQHTQLTPPSSERCNSKPVSLFELSFHVSLILEEDRVVAVKLLGDAGTRGAGVGVRVGVLVGVGVFVALGCGVLVGVGVEVGVGVAVGGGGWDEASRRTKLATDGTPLPFRMKSM